MVLQNFRQAVKRNSARQMVEMVDADISGHPHQRFRQIIERTAMEGRFWVRPVGLVIPICALELVLHIEQPHADRRANHDDR